MIIIDVKNLNRKYTYIVKRHGIKGALIGLFKPLRREKMAVQNLNLTVEKGEILGLIGPNGAGKTTLIKMLTGIITSTAGQIFVLGFNPSNHEDNFKKKIAVVMGQKSQLWWDLSAADVFLLNKEIYQIPDDVYAKKVEELATIFEVKDLLDVQVRQLSLGERMKMELIASLLHSPEIIFLDEPTIGLDAIAQKQIRLFLKEINEKYGVTILLTSHYMEDIISLCKRVVVINHGNKIYDGELNYLLEIHKEFKQVKVTFAQYTRITIKNCEILEEDDSSIKFRVQKEQMANVLSDIMRAQDVLDINIEEEGIEDLISKIYKEK